MSSKHAYLIIAHNQFKLLELLCRCLDYPLHDLYIHIDKKVESFDYDGLKSKLRYSNVTFVSERINVSWGGYSQIRSELELFKSAVSQEYEYYHIVSGVDLPLWTAQELYAFFHKNKGKEFVHFSPAEYCNSKGLFDRVKYYHLLQETVKRSSTVTGFVEKCLVGIQRKIKINRLKRVPETIKCGANWVSLTHDFVLLVLEKESWIRKTFRYSFCADEVFIQTILWNSSFKNNVYMPNDRGDYHSCMRYVDWERGKPYTFRMEDFDDLISSDFAFARKFDYNTDPELCERLTSRLLDRSKANDY